MPTRQPKVNRPKRLKWTDWFRRFEGSVYRLHPGVCEETIRGEPCICGYGPEERQKSAKQIYARNATPAQAAHHYERGCSLACRRTRCDSHSFLEGVCAHCGHSLACAAALEKDYAASAEARGFDMKIEVWRARVLALRATARLIENLIDMGLDGAMFGKSGADSDPEQLEKAFQNRMKALRTLVEGVS